MTRLHFAETKFDAPKMRLFNVDINGKRVLTDLDIFADAGGKNKALVKDIPNVLPNAAGKIEIAFTSGTVDNPKICGIQVVASLPQ